MTDDQPYRIPLATWPTPLERAPRLAAAIGLGEDDLWIKRDDLTGLGGGGNKIRKLEFTCAQAISDGASALVTTGAPQSNHARLTAAAGARLGLDVHLVLRGDGSAPVEGNLALESLFGAHVHWASDVTSAASAVAEELVRQGVKTTVIPFGGTSVTAAHGYARCGRELLTQTTVDLVVTALGSGGTMAGLVHCLGADRVLGVDTGAVPSPAEQVRAVLDGLARESTLNLPDPGPEEPLRIRSDQVGAGYDRLTGPVLEAMELAARTEGLVLDPVYSGRALAGLRAAVLDGEVTPGHRVVFLHSGGLPGLFGHRELMSSLARGTRAG